MLNLEKGRLKRNLSALSKHWADVEKIDAFDRLTLKEKLATYAKLQKIRFWLNRKKESQL